MEPTGVTQGQDILYVLPASSNNPGAIRPAKMVFFQQIGRIWQYFIVVFLAGDGVSLPYDYSATQTVMNTTAAYYQAGSEGTWQFPA
jgi:hypothetical protein